MPAPALAAVMSAKSDAPCPTEVAPEPPDDLFFERESQHVALQQEATLLLAIVIVECVNAVDMPNVCTKPEPLVKEPRVTKPNHSRVCWA